MKNSLIRGLSCRQIMDHCIYKYSNFKDGMKETIGGTLAGRVYKRSHSAYHDYSNLTNTSHVQLYT